LYISPRVSCSTWCCSCCICARCPWPACVVSCACELYRINILLLLLHVLAATHARINTLLNMLAGTYARTHAHTDIH
jgi:hypothetical protein